MVTLHGKIRAEAGDVGIGQTGEAKQPEIPAVMDDLRIRTDLLHEIIGHLESRLEMVCRPDPADGEEADGRSTSTIMGEFLYSQADKVNHANNRLSRILRLLEL